LFLQFTPFWESFSCSPALKPLRERLKGFQADASISIIALLMAGITLTQYTFLHPKKLTYFFNVIFLYFDSDPLRWIQHGRYRNSKHCIVLFILLIFARYFDFFWELLPNRLFHARGLVLLVISIVLERKRRDLKVQVFRGEQ
jgi:uncharacterized membrane protein